jgi:putative phosphoesterase
VTGREREVDRGACVPPATIARRPNTERYYESEAVASIFDRVDDARWKRQRSLLQGPVWNVSRGRWTRKLNLVEERTAVAPPVVVGVISDTHVSSQRSYGAVRMALDLFKRRKVGLILHGGDVGHASLLNEMETIAPVAAVRGNADSLDLIETLPDRVWIEAGNQLILLLHGHHGKTARQSALAAVQPGVDVIVFGHSHQPLIEQHDETVLFNPGSPTERRWGPHFGVGFLTIAESGIEPELVLFDDPRQLAAVDA